MCLHPDVMAALLKHEAPEIIDIIYRAAWAAERSAVTSLPAQAPAQAAEEIRTGPLATATKEALRSGEHPSREDERREAARVRQKRKRDADRAAKAQMDMFPVSVAASNDRVTGVTPQRDSVTEPRDTPVSTRARSSSSFLERKKEEGGGGGARATPLVLISPEAVSIADEVAVIAGLDPADRLATPPGWCGAAARVQTWMAHWTRETILAGARSGMAGKRDGPPESPRYFEKPIARVHLQLSAPLPKIVDLESTYARAAVPKRRKTMLECFDDLAAEYA